MEKTTGNRGYNPMVRVVWLNTSQRRRPRGRQARGRLRGLVSSHTMRTIGLYPTYHHSAWKGMFLWSVDLPPRSSNGKQWWIWRSHAVNDLTQRPDLVLVALFVSFGRRSSIKTSSSSSYSDASPLSSSGSSPFELISEYRRWKTAFHRPFSFRFSIFQPCGMA